MINIAGIALPERSVWSNKSSYGVPASVTVTDIYGFEHIYTGSGAGDIDIHIPQTKDGLTREDAAAIADLAAACAKISVTLDDKSITAVFRYGDNPVELSPSLNQGIFYGNIRLREV